MANIEVEVRGKLEGDFDKIISIFKEKAKFIKEKDRFSLIYSRRVLSKDVREIREDPLDLRLRITNKIPEMMLKFGRWGTRDQRHEISLPVSLENFEEAVDFLRYLDWNCGVITTTKTFVFDYKEIEFALVKNEIYNYFEAEMMVKDKSETEKARKTILSIIKEFGLKIIDEEEFINMLNKMNNAPGMQFDFKKQSFKEIKERFKEFF